MKKLLVFDMDGTLVDSSDVIVNSINHIRKYLGLKSLTKDIVLKNINDPKIDGNKFFYNNTYFDDKMTKQFNEYYNKNCIKDLKIFDNIDVFLKDLKKEYILVVATNTPTNLAKKMLKHLNILHHFKFIVGSDLITKPKPNPDILFYILSKFSLHNTEALFIGDSLKDKQCAHNANIDFIHVNWEEDSTHYISSKIKRL